MVKNLLALLLIAAPASALELQLPAQARVVYESAQEQDNYLLVQGIYKRINNEWRVQGEQLLSGYLKSQTLELPRTANEQEAFAALRQQLGNYQRRELFECENLLCGTSNAWANTHFKKSVLYGIDTSQRYGVYETQDRQGRVVYVVLYAVKRGNGSVYVQLDQLQVGSGEQGRLVTPAKSILQGLAERGYFSIPLSLVEGRIVIASAQLQELATAIKSERGRRFVLVGHDYASGDALAAGQKNAEQVAELLLGQGLSQVPEVFSVGRYAPAGRGAQSVRVDLVAQ